MDNWAVECRDVNETQWALMMTRGAEQMHLYSTRARARMAAQELRDQGWITRIRRYRARRIAGSRG